MYIFTIIALVYIYYSFLLVFAIKCIIEGFKKKTKPDLGLAEYVDKVKKLNILIKKISEGGEK
jgi:hypothetical protein